MANTAEPAGDETPGLSQAAYDALVDAAETYRAALVVRLAGEAGLRTGEITRVRPSDLREVGNDDHGLLTVYDEDGDATRTAYVPPSLAAELRRYVDSMGLAEDERFVDVSERRVQMIVDETADHAADRTDAVDPDRVAPRELRQFFAHRLLTEREIDPRVVRAIGGWETLGALDPYLDHPDDPEIVAAFDDRPRAEPARETPPATDAVLDALDVVATAGTRAELLTGIPERLAATPDWEAAWIATRERTEDEVGVAAAAGIDATELSDRGLRTTDEDAPWMRAITAAERTVGEGVGADGRDNEDDGGGVDSPAGEREDDSVESADNEGDRVGDDGTTEVVSGSTDDLVILVGEDVVAVPLAYQGTSYGVLCLLSDEVEENGVGTENSPVVPAPYRRALVRLGGVVGRSLASFRWHDLLHSDTVLELTFETSASTAFPVRVTDALDCRVELDSTVTTDDALLIYVDVDGATPHDVADVSSDVAGIEDTRVVDTREDGCTLGFVVTGSSPAYTLADHGATVRAASASDGELRVVADVPTGTDVRPLAEGLRRTFPDARLVGKQELDRDPGSETSFRDDVEERLTDRQRATLKAAYHGGYFDWPREITAEEVADAMDVSSPTLHNHLRKGQRALLDGLFDGDDGRV
ncbi:MAG: bacterio-opsin activator domain-containing protein [Halopenitus sp.]